MRVFSKRNEQERTKRNNIKSIINNEYRQIIGKSSRECSQQSSGKRNNGSNLKGLNDIIENIRKANNLIELIYSIESLAYYFDMKPHEFWNSRYSEINIYCQTHLLKIIDNLKSEINLQESVTNKLIRADSMSKDPKIILIRDDYKELFKIEEKEQTLEEQRMLFKG